MTYSEAAYFEGDYCHHVGVWQERKWLAERVARNMERLRRNVRCRG